ncbi:MAG TPA: hypothetical protein VGI45_29300 [Terracidiphilus sp.]|jgi:hypothetical protein
MRIWRSHPVLFASLIGAVLGFGNALAIEIPALLGKPSKGALSLLEPASGLHVGTGVLETAFLLLIEIGANVLVYAAMFCLLGWVIVGARHLFRSARRTKNANDSPQS